MFTSFLLLLLAIQTDLTQTNHDNAKFLLIISALGFNVIHVFLQMLGLKNVRPELRYLDLVLGIAYLGFCILIVSIFPSEPNYSPLFSLRVWQS